MTRYSNEAEAREDGFFIEHQPETHRFAVLKRAQPDEVVGEAHYTLIGDSTIDFDHTLVEESLRGTGLSGLLAHHALTSTLATTREVRASCWFIEGYLKRHPELARR